MSEDQSMRHAVHGLHLATDPSVSSAWLLFFRECRRLAQEIRSRQSEEHSDVPPEIPSAQREGA